MIKAYSLTSGETKEINILNDFADAFPEEGDKFLTYARMAITTDPTEEGVRFRADWRLKGVGTGSQSAWTVDADSYLVCRSQEMGESTTVGHGGQVPSLSDTAGKKCNVLSKFRVINKQTLAINIEVEILGK